MADDNRPPNPLERRLGKQIYTPSAASREKPGRLAKVSIVVTCYNYARFLPDSIGSALSQEGVEPEVIVVDDASTDSSAAVAQQFADKDPRVRVLRHKRNAGPVIAFNDGYAEATGEFIVRLDADDLLTPGSLARSVALFDVFPSVGLVYGHPRHFATALPPAPRVGPVRSWSIWPGIDWLAERCRRGYNVITSPEAVNRASVLKLIGPLNPKLRFAHDMEMWLRTAAVSDIGRVDGPDQALHRDHKASLTADGRHMVDIEARRDAFQIAFESTAGRLPFADQMHEAAKRALATEALEEACRAYDRGRTGSIDVDSYVKFALGTYPDATNLSQWRALSRRRWVGPTLAPVFPIFFPSILKRRLRHEYNYRRWTETGL